jgi:hypothetical protein
MHRWSYLLLLPGLLALAGCGDGDNGDDDVSATINTLYSSDAVKGGKGLLRIALGNAASERTKVSLSSSAPDVIDLPSSVTFPAGGRSLDIEFEGKATGTTAIRAAVGESSLMTTADVVDSLQLTPLYSSSSAYVVGSIGTISAELNARVSSPRSIQVTSSASDIVDVEGSSEFAAFDWWAPIGFSALAVGHADITVDFEGATRTYGIDVVERAELESFIASERVQVGAIVSPSVQLSAASSNDSVVAMTSDNPEVLALPGTLSVPGGETYHSFSTVAAAPGVVTLTAEYGGDSLSRTINVVEEVAVTSVGIETRGNLMVGTSTELFVYVDALVAADLPVSISVDKPEILSVPESMIIPSREEAATKTITALAEGTAEITVAVGESTRTLQVEVVKDPSVLYINGPSTLIAGSSDELYIELDASAQDADIMLTSSDPDVLSVTSTTYASTIEATLTAHKPGTALVTIRVGDNFRSWFVSVIEAAALEYVSFSSPVVTGTAGVLNAYLNVPVPTKTELALESSNSEVLEVPSSISIPAGSSNVVLPLIAGKPGFAILSLTLNDVTFTTDVTVVDHAGFSQAYVGPGNIAKGDTTVLTVGLTALAQEDVELEFTYEVEGVVSGPATGVIPAGSRSAQFLLTAEAAGSTTILIEGGGESTIASVYVAEKVELVQLNTQGSIPVGQSAMFGLGLNVNNAKPVTVTLASDAPDVVSVPEKVVIPAGFGYMEVPIKGLSEGDATITASYDGVELTTLIQVFTPAP